MVERRPGPVYFKKLRFAEIAPPEPLPRPSVLGKWRDAVPKDAVLSLLAPTSTLGAGFHEGDALREGITWLAGATKALAASALVIPTGKELSTSGRDRARLAAFVVALRKRGAPPLVWHPAGLWEREDAQEQADAMGIVLAFDPLGEEVPTGPLAYGRLRAIGQRSRLGEGPLRGVADLMYQSDAPLTLVAIHAAKSLRPAQRIAALLMSTNGASRADLDEDEEDDDPGEESDLDDEDEGDLDDEESDLDDDDLDEESDLDDEDDDEADR